MGVEGGRGRMEVERLCDRKGEWREMEGDGVGSGICISLQKI